MANISMAKVRARLNRVLAASKKVEAVKPRRGWSGRINNIDKLLAWMYDNNIMNKGEKAKKDTLFHSYYRYYNDGDFPRVLSPLGYSRWTPEEKIETALEELLEAFIKKILAKYAGKYSRRDFHYDQYMEQLNDVIRSIDNSNGTGAHNINYWMDKLANPDEELVKLNNELQSLDKQFTTEVEKVAAIPEVKDYLDKKNVSRLSSYTNNYIKDVLGKYWTPELESYLKKMGVIGYKMKNKLLKVKEAATKLKNEGVF